ncbi:GNAT family N-acetyltransferase [Cesiribacter sp. SM1]|uniref:GNAT family N-acetyltransferase n=1 Tax=Cesiribacter sp. SM1 TaxID=2861196 RepID=UPI001CD59E75|nr:GNAT family N-acetyltransferase [Cesiribacter sp. SM1]
MKSYLFTSQRLGFRNWRQADLQPMAALNADPEVMAYFPGTASEEETYRFIERMQQQYAERGFCYFAVDKLEDGEFIGFIGLSEQNYQAYFTPCTDIGWRLKKSAWGQGFATEGAKACLDYTFSRLGLEKVYAVAPLVNTPSENVMKKIGMQPLKTFMHPLLLQDERLRECMVYMIDKHRYHNAPAPLAERPDVE